MTTRKALELAGRLTVDPELDCDSELELSLDTDCEYGVHYLFLTFQEVKALRAYLDELLKEVTK